MINGHRPKEGPQLDFMLCEADGALYGGEAGSGKTFVLQLESCRYAPDPTYTGIIFRRISTSITTPGGMWDSGQEIYRDKGAILTKHNLTVKFPEGGVVKYSHLENEADKYGHHGGQYCFLGFDELPEFTYSMWLYLQTRNRPKGESKLLPYWRATGNANADSWVRDLIDWWIDPVTGYAIKERCGVLRYYTIEDDIIKWVNKDWKNENGVGPQSFTFFSAGLDDNPVEKGWRDRYRSNINAKDRVTRERLGRGNWNISSKGGMFEQGWFKKVDRVPDGASYFRYWDFAATEAEEGKDPDWTSGALCAVASGEFYIVDIKRMRAKPANIEKTVKEVAERDGYAVPVAFEEEKGSSGKFVSDHYHRTVLKGYEVHPDPVTGEKTDRAKPWSALAEQGHVYIVDGEWNRTFLAEAGSFPLNKKDQIDSVSGAYKMLTRVNKVWPAYQYKNFKSINLKWSEMEQQNIVIVINLVGDKKNGIYGLCALWGRKSQKLYVYAEIVQSNVVVDDLCLDIRKKAVVSLEKKAAGLYVDKVFVSESLDSGGDDVRKLLRKAGIRSVVNSRADDTGGAVKVNSMFNNDEIVVDSSCTEADRQFKEWTYREKAGGRPMEGFPLCKALCGVVTELKAARELEEPRKEAPYSYASKRVREKLKQGVLPLGPQKGIPYNPDRGMMP